MESIHIHDSGLRSPLGAHLRSPLGAHLRSPLGVLTTPLSTPKRPTTGHVHVHVPDTPEIDVRKNILSCAMRCGSRGISSRWNSLTLTLTLTLILTLIGGLSRGSTGIAVASYLMGYRAHMEGVETIGLVREALGIFHAKAVKAGSVKKKGLKVSVDADKERGRRLLCEKELTLCKKEKEEKEKELTLCKKEKEGVILELKGKTLELEEAHMELKCLREETETKSETEESLTPPAAVTDPQSTGTVASEALQRDALVRDLISSRCAEQELQNTVYSLEKNLSFKILNSKELQNTVYSLEKNLFESRRELSELSESLVKEGAKVGTPLEVKHQCLLLSMDSLPEEAFFQDLELETDERLQTSSEKRCVANILNLRTKLERAAFEATVLDEKYVEREIENAMQREKISELSAEIGLSKQGMIAAQEVAQEMAIELLTLKDGKEEAERSLGEMSKEVEEVKLTLQKAQDEVKLTLQKEAEVSKERENTSKIVKSETSEAMEESLKEALNELSRAREELTHSKAELSRAREELTRSEEELTHANKAHEALRQEKAQDKEKIKEAAELEAMAAQTAQILQEAESAKEALLQADTIRLNMKAVEAEALVKAWALTEAASEAEHAAEEVAQLQMSPGGVGDEKEQDLLIAECERLRDALAASEIDYVTTQVEAERLRKALTASEARSMSQEKDARDGDEEEEEEEDAKSDLISEESSALKREVDRLKTEYPNPNPDPNPNCRLIG